MPRAFRVLMLMVPTAGATGRGYPAHAPHPPAGVGTTVAAGRSRTPPMPLDLRVPDGAEAIEVHGRRPRFTAAPVPGRTDPDGPSARAIFDPKTGASIGEFGWAYVLAAP